VLRVAAALIALLIVVATATLVPFHSEICRENPLTYAEKCSAYSLALVVWWHLGEWLNYYSAGITALATGAIGIFTWTLYRVTRDGLAHSHKVERAYISAGGFRHREESGLSARDTPTYRDTNLFQFNVNNFGKTPGRVVAIVCDFFRADGIPATPPVSRARHMNSWINPGQEGLGLDIFEISPECTVAYGRVWFETIFGTFHSSGFLYQIGNKGRGSRSIAPPHPDYTAENTYRDEREARASAGVS
jgi:hypothetical protein